MSDSVIDPVELTAALVRCPSVTPLEAGAITLLQELLAGHGFECTRADRGGICNLIARVGPKNAQRTFGFNGHVDVVPIGDAAAWSVDPFGAQIKEGILYGRGATDMKSGVAAFVAAAVAHRDRLGQGDAILITITGDEEGDAIDGTTAILEKMAQMGEAMDVCLVGEPTSPNTLGDMMKVGRRGSMTSYFTANGVQGHSAYPHRAKNPVHAMAQLMDRLARAQIDQGTDQFDPSTLAVVSIETGNDANNVIPETCRSTVNIRFNDAHTSAGLTTWLEREAAQVAADTGVIFDMTVKVSGESFVTEPGPFSDMIAAAVRAETGLDPELSTSGGTSDARFIRAHCPVVEFGLVGQSMHKVDEHVALSDIKGLTRIYGRILEHYFA